MKWSCFLNCISFISVTFCVSLEKGNSNNRFTIESRRHFTESLLKELSELKFTVLHKITKSVYIFEYEGLINSKKLQDVVMCTVGDQVYDIEPTRVYVNSLKPASSNGNDETSNMENLVCDYYYGMGIDKVWKRNITGLGVTIAINDVGIDTDLDDIEQNINKELSKDLFNNKTDISPEHFEYIVDNPPAMSAHGNHVTSVVAAVKGNNLCSAGIAFNATVVGIKMWAIELKENTFNVKTKTEIISRALNYEYDKIDIYVNALRPVSHFDQLDLATRRTIEDAALNGRKGLGAIHVVPAGPYGNALSNNIYTISVNGLYRPGHSFTDVNHDASVLTSGLRYGNNLTSLSMVTTIFGNKCVRSFNGDSAAVAQVSGIIALGLQANPRLRLRDVQHLLVQASGYGELIGRVKFEMNGALRKYSEKFGFGLINADKFVSLAIDHKSVPDLQSRNLFEYEKRDDERYTQIYEFCYSCSKGMSCLNSLEHVALDISFESFADNVKLSLISPNGTVSFVMDLPTVKENETSVSHKGKFVSVHFWDELPFGKWQIKVQSNALSESTTVNNISITLYGTRRANQLEDQNYCGSDDNNNHSNDTKIIIIGFVVVGIALCVVSVIVRVCIIKKNWIRRQVFNVMPCVRSDDSGNERETRVARSDDRGNERETRVARSDDRGNERDRKKSSDDLFTETEESCLTGQ